MNLSPGLNQNQSCSFHPLLSDCYQTSSSICSSLAVFIPISSSKVAPQWDFPSGPVAKNACSQCSKSGVKSLVRKLNPTCHNLRSWVVQLKTQHDQINFKKKKSSPSKDTYPFAYQFLLYFNEIFSKSIHISIHFIQNIYLASPAPIYVSNIKIAFSFFIC